MFGTNEHGAILKQSRAGMKRPRSPGLLENVLPPKAEEEEEDEEEERAAPGRRPKRERRQSSVTLCEVCNIQLNSLAQAQIHYNGKTHQRRLRQFNLAKASNATHTHTGTLSQANPLLASLSLPGRPLQTQLDIKHFLPLHVNASSPLNLFPNFNMSGLFCVRQMDPVQKAVINHTFGVAPPKRKQIISCNICHLRFNSTNQAEAHYKGHKHARKLKSMDAQRNRQRGQGSMAGRERDRERGKTGVEKSLPALMDPSLTEGTGLLSSPQLTTRPKLDDTLQGVSPTPMPISETSSLDVLALISPQVSPAVYQLSELTSDGSPMEGPSPTPDSNPSLEGQGESPGAPGGEEETSQGKKSPPTKQHLHCPMCKITVNSSSQLEAHYSGSKHKQMLEGQAGAQARHRGKVMSLPRPTCRSKQAISSKARVGVALASQPFHCEMCEVSVNSETQLKQHMSSRRHKDRLSGKPQKPKFSPYTKSQPNPLLASVRWSGFPFGGVTSAIGKLASHCHLSTYSPQTKLALQKQLSKALSAGFLASHMNPATLCTMASNPLTLRGPPGPGHTPLIQTPLLSPALFRPAPGPLRATHRPIIFSPY
ncbi:zinc finger protein 385C-like isoform X2 [Salvelinus fontinalis]|uniref:zinc finger protein 385C-like isoform X2 n=1 Tax=Salvelinus fontinalis TaxID=8038 RepID=UPI0024854231|nr:zinc finger protein 385C-like isoform X2 [Salvelinus fontinalis]